MLLIGTGGGSLNELDSEDFRFDAAEWEFLEDLCA